MKIGFIGLGTMGASFASNLQKAGHSLVVHDVSRQVAEQHLQAGAEWADTPKALAHKDISLACELGRDVGVPMRMANLAQQEMREALNRDWGHRDSRAYLLLQQERAGILIDESREDVAAVLAADPANQAKKTG